VPGLTVATNRDLSGIEWNCTPAQTVIAQAKDLYYLGRALRILIP